MIEKGILSQKYLGRKHTPIITSSLIHPIANKCAVVRTLKTRAERICTDKKDLEKELEHIHDALSQNGYPKRFINRYKKGGEHKEAEKSKATIVIHT